MVEVSRGLHSFRAVAAVAASLVHPTQLNARSAPCCKCWQCWLSLRHHNSPNDQERRCKSKPAARARPRSARPVQGVLGCPTHNSPLSPRRSTRDFRDRARLTRFCWERWSWQPRQAPVDLRFATEALNGLRVHSVAPLEQGLPNLAAVTCCCLPLAALLVRSHFNNARFAISPGGPNLREPSRSLRPDRQTPDGL